MNWYLETLKQYVISGGQVPRKGSWIFTLFIFIMGCVLGFVLGFVEILVGGPVFFVVLIGLCGSAVLIPSIAVSVNTQRRQSKWVVVAYQFYSAHRFYDFAWLRRKR